MGNGVTARTAVTLGLGLVLIGGCGDDREPEGRARAHAAVEVLRGPWQPMPLVLDPALLADAQVECLRGAVDAEIGPANAAVVVADARGGGVLQVAFVAPNGDEFVCLQMPISPTGDVTNSGAMTGSGGGGPIRPLGPFDLNATGGGFSTGPNDEPLHATVVGRAGPGIARVHIEAAGQPRIVATLRNGWFAAWWPGSPRATAVGYNAADGEVARISLE